MATALVASISAGLIRHGRVGMILVAISNIPYDLYPQDKTIVRILSLQKNPQIAS
jgi:hypothetical protein